MYLCTHNPGVLSLNHILKSSIHETSYSAAHECILATANIRRECPRVHNNAAFKPVHVGLKEILDHCEAAILVIASARSFNIYIYIYINEDCNKKGLVPGYDNFLRSRLHIYL